MVSQKTNGQPAHQGAGKKVVEVAEADNEAIYMTTWDDRFAGDDVEVLLAEEPSIEEQKTFLKGDQAIVRIHRSEQSTDLLVKGPAGAVIKIVSILAITFIIVAVFYFSQH